MPSPSMYFYDTSVQADPGSYWGMTGPPPCSTPGRALSCPGVGPVSMFALDDDGEKLPGHGGEITFIFSPA